MRRRPSELLPLSPLGTARQRLSPAPAYPPELAAELRAADLGDEGLYLAWQVTAWAGDVSAADRAALMTIVGRALVDLAQGSTRVSVDAAARTLLARLPELVGSPAADRRPLLLDGQYLYPQKLFAGEDRLVRALAARLGEPSTFTKKNIDAAVKLVIGTSEPPPTDEQRDAVRTALARRFCVVTGGPGTGKTTIALALVRALVHLGVSPTAIALAAPTGKAANRLDEALRLGLARSGDHALEETLRQSPPVAETLHRLLGYGPHVGAFQFGEHNRLPYRAVIVDEGSMIDLFLTERLASAVADDATLIIMGDADQLPSVEAGAVFRELAPFGVQLARSFRMDPARAEGRRILEVASAIKTGNTATLETVLVARVTAESLTFAGVETLPAAAREPLLERWYADRLAAPPEFEALVSHAYALYDDGFASEDEARLALLSRHYQSLRVLCATRAQPTGVDAVNAWLHRRHGASSAALVAGEPILMLRNDYDRGLFNGDQGLVIRVRQPGRAPRLMATFIVDGRWSVWDLDSLRDVVELAFAMTVHKAQGSEYDDVALVLPETPIPLLTRELIYTALTRARRSVVICGATSVLTAGVEKVMTRSSGIGEKLAALVRR